MRAATTALGAAVSRELKKNWVNGAAMPECYFCPFPAFKEDLHIINTIKHYGHKNYVQVREGTNQQVAAQDPLHIVGHGSELDPTVITLNPTSKGQISVGVLANMIANLITPQHKLIVLDMCFAFGYYATNSTKWMGVINKAAGERTYVAYELAKIMGTTYKDLQIRGSANPVITIMTETGPQTSHTCAHPNSDVKSAFTPLKSGGQSETKWVFDRVLYDIDASLKVVDVRTGNIVADSKKLPALGS